MERRRRERPLCRPIAHHHRAGREVAKALVALREEDEQHARHEGGEREPKVDKAQQVPHCRRAQRHGTAGVHDHPDAEGHFAGGAPTVQALEQRVIDEQERKDEHEEEDRERPVSRRALQIEQQSEDQPAQDLEDPKKEGIEQCGGRA